MGPRDPFEWLQEIILPYSRNRTNILWSSRPSPSQHTDRANFAHISDTHCYTRVETLIVVTIYLQLIQNRYMFRSFTVLLCSHQHCVQPVASDVEVVGYL